MDLSTTANVINAAAVTAGVIFAFTQLRDFRAQRRRQAMYSLMQSFRTPQFADALLRVLELPENLDHAAITAAVGRQGEQEIHFLMTTYESNGVMVFHNELTLALVEDFYSGPITICWRKTRSWVEEMRKDAGRETIFEWFQWLAEQITEHEKATPTVPAHVAHRTWRKARPSPTSDR